LSLSLPSTRQQQIISFPLQRLLDDSQSVNGTESNQPVQHATVEDKTDLVVLVLLNALWVHLPLIVISNMFVIFATTFVKKFHNPHNAFICGISFADLSTGLITLPLIWLMATKTTMVTLFGTKTNCFLSLYVMFITTRISSSYLCLLSIERVLALKCSLKYSKHSSVKTAVITMVLIFIAVTFQWCLLVSFPTEENTWIDGLPKTNNTLQCQVNTRYSNPHVQISVHVFGLCTILLLFNAAIFFVHIKRTQEKEYRIQATPPSTLEHINSQLISLKVAIYINFIFLILWLPFPQFFSWNRGIYYKMDLIYLHFTFVNAWIKMIVYRQINPTHRRAFHFCYINPPWKWNRIEGHYSDYF